MHALAEMHALVLRVANAICINGKHGLGFRKARRIIDFTDTCLPLTLSEVESCSGCMGHDVATDWFLGIGVEHGSGTIHLSDDLVCNHNSNAKLAAGKS